MSSHCLASPPVLIPIGLVPFSPSRSQDSGEFHPLSRVQFRLSATATERILFQRKRASGSARN